MCSLGLSCSHRQTGNILGGSRGLEMREGLCAIPVKPHRPLASKGQKESVAHAPGPYQLFQGCQHVRDSTLCPDLPLPRAQQSRAVPPSWAPIPGYHAALRISPTPGAHHNTRQKVASWCSHPERGAESSFQGGHSPSPDPASSK